MIWARLVSPRRAEKVSQAARSAAEPLFLAAVALGPFLFGSVEPWARGLIEALAFSAALACLLGNRDGNVGPEPLFWTALGFAVLGSLQGLSRTSPDGPRLGWLLTAAPDATARAVHWWTACAALIWTAPRVVRTPSSCRRFAWIIFLAGAAVACIGLAQEAAGMRFILYGFRFADPKGSPFGPFYNDDHAASLMAMSLCFGAGVALSRMRLMNRSQSGHTAHEWLGSQLGLLFLMLLIVAGLWACGSQAGWLSILFAIGVCAFFAAAALPSRRDRREAVAVCLVAAVIAIFAAFNRVDDSLTVNAKADAAVVDRAAMYSAAIDALRDFPLGSGLGSFQRIYPAYQDRGVRGIVEHAHSDWLELSIEAGLPMTILLFSSVLWCLARAYTAWRFAVSREMRGLIAGSAAAAAAFAFHMFFDFSFQIPGDAFVFLAVLSWLGASHEWADKAPARLSGYGRPLWVKAGACALLALYFSSSLKSFWTGGSRGPGPYYHGLALRAYNEGLRDGEDGRDALREAVGWVDAALRADPLNSDYLYLKSAALRRVGRFADASDTFLKAQTLRFAPVAQKRRKARAW